MNKYFEKNYFANSADDWNDVGETLWRAFRTLSHNVEVKVAMPHLKRKCVEGREAEFDENIAGTALLMIAACEALLSKLDNGTVEMARERVEKDLAMEPIDELKDMLREALGVE